MRGLLLKFLPVREDFLSGKLVLEFLSGKDTVP